MYPHLSPDTLLSDTTISLRDDRLLAVREWGNPNGHPVLFFHGKPGSRMYCPDRYPRVTRRTTDCGVRLVTVDRPGYSGSTPKPGRTLLDWPDDVAQLLDHLRIERLPIVGHSGGGPYAMACGVRIPQRVTRLGLVSSDPPVDEVSGWIANYRAEYQDDEERRLTDLARADATAALPEVEAHCAWLRDAPDALISGWEGWPDGDRLTMSDPATREVFLSDVEEAGRAGIDGLVWDEMSVQFLPWGFSPRDVRAETYIWHGDDEWTPLGVFHYLRSTIPGARGRTWDAGHLALLRDGHWGEVLETIIA